MAKKTKSDKIQTPDPAFRPTKPKPKKMPKEDRPKAPRLTLFNLGADFDHALLREGLLTQVESAEVVEFQDRKPNGQPGPERFWLIHFRIADTVQEASVNFRSRRFQSRRGAYEAFERFLNALKPLGVAFTGAPLELPPEDPRPAHGDEEGEESNGQARDGLEPGPYAPKPAFALPLGDDEAVPEAGGAYEPEEVDRKEDLS